MKLKGSQTEKNLHKTFSGESRARGRYNLFAEKARKEGYNWVGDVFDEIAENEYAHSREVFKRFLGKVEGTEENLLDSIKAETKEYEKTYKEFEKVARKEGFEEIANFYKELREVEESHKERFEDLSERLKTNTMFKSDKVTYWKCLNCGYIHEGKKAPDACPLCNYPQKYFKPYTKGCNE